MKFETSSISVPWIVLLEVISPEAVLEACFSQAHSSLSHWMLCCSLVALLALILCRALFPPMKKGTVCGKTNQDAQGANKRKVRTRAWNCGDLAGEKLV